MAVDVVIVGAGFGGLAALHAAQARGLNAIAVEAGHGPGGTWYWNRYPGARCDIESVQYSLPCGDAMRWRWSERYASQDEILRYAEAIVDHHGLRDAIRFGWRLRSAIFDETRAKWILQNEEGEEIVASFCIMATGTLSTTYLPHIPGIEKFGGVVYHTGRWPHDGARLAGKRVGVIGNGSSGVQIIPEAGKVAAHLTVFQRTAPYVAPAGNRPLDGAELDEVLAHYPERRRAWRAFPTAVGVRGNNQSVLAVDETERRAVFERAWAAGGPDFGACFNDLSRTPEGGAEVQSYFHWKIGQIVKDAATAEAIKPRLEWGTRRLCFGTDYYETFNRDNVSLVDLGATPIDDFTATGIIAGGQEHQLDVLVMATGFDAVTGTLLAMDIRGRGGVSLKEAWQHGPQTYLGLAVSGFPNLFMISGPQTPATMINVAVGIDYHADWIADCIRWLRDQAIRSIEAADAAQELWTERTAQVAARSVMSRGTSWWNGANIPGKPKGVLGYLDWLDYRACCDEARNSGYSDFIQEPSGATLAPRTMTGAAM